MRRTVGIDAANQIYRDRVFASFWTVRYFRDSQPEEYFVVLRPDGTLHSVHHTLAEATPGANLSKEDAQSRAAAFLRGDKGFDLAQWKVVATQSDKRQARTDHTFTWEQIAALDPVPPGAEGAHVRAELQVQGDEVSGYRIFIHVPEEWERQQNQTTLAGMAKGIGLMALVSGLAVVVLIAFFRSLGRPEIAAVPWRSIAMSSLAVLVAAVATFATSAPQYLANYRTALPFRTYVATSVILLSLSATAIYTGVFFLSGLAWLFLSRGYGVERLPGFGAKPPIYYRDALVVALAGGATLLGLGRLPDLLARTWPAPQHALLANVPGGLDATWLAMHARGRCGNAQFGGRRIAGAGFLGFCVVLFAARVGRRSTAAGCVGPC